ncbi:cardiac-enriched FHL2-interacting protein [Pristis pectinata]|uniref:cardiac-enriched FHL2-interacting protein n=1 Tax=Pristis pectinata TaxID=685728 RepID=UPI00223E3225|nr:cardiac-enriched FHL2-interacting protein [Pristis pectinata]XP_051897353.1 cardiac-enriched FHL2-interacting protein [Pristis pectinata]XP_051897354.1 cardiac-enriched FHL2-interacting protein [Pristis pectinata]
MDTLNNRGSAKTKVMQGHSKPVDGFSDTSSVGSILDEADREVSSLTERAFKSLCVVEEGMCNESEVHSSPSAVNVNHAAPGTEGKKHSAGELKNCNMSPKLIKKQPKELPETFQESTGQYSVGEAKGDKCNMGNGFLIEAMESNQKYQQKPKVSSLVGAFDQNDRDFTGTEALSGKPASHPEPPGEDAIKNIAQFDASAIVNLHREKSSFSATCQENYWINKKHQPQDKGGKTNILGYLKSSQYRKPTDFKNLHHSGTKFDKTLSEKVNRLKKLDTKNSFLHSECSAFKSWQDHSKSLFEEDTPPETHNANLQSNVHLQGSDENIITQKQAPSLVQAKSPNKVKASMMQNAVNCSPSNKDTNFHAPVSEEKHHAAKVNQDRGDSSQMVRPEEDSGGTVENGVEAKGFQLWRNSRYPLYKKQMEAELVSVDEPSTKSPPVTEAATLAAPIPQEESPSFCISKLLAPSVVANPNGIERSKNQPIVVTPPLLHPCTNQGDEIRSDNQSFLGYKSKATSLMYNLKDVRKRVKSTYSSAGTPQSVSEPAKNKHYVHQNISARTSSAPVRLGIRENIVTDTSEQRKHDTVPNAADVRPTADYLKAAVVPKAELDAWKNDDYLNLRSPQTVKEGGSYPGWRTKSSRPQSAMTASEVHAGRGLERRVAHQLNKLTAKEKADHSTTTLQKDSVSASGSPERAVIAQEKAEQKQSRFHGNRKPEYDLVSHPQKEIRPHERHSRRQEGKLTSQRVQDAGCPTRDQSASSHWGSSHSTREDKTRHDLKSYIDLGNSHSQGPEQAVVNHSREPCTGTTKSRPAAENDKNFEKNELQYYALSDPTTSSERGGEKQNTPMMFQSHSQQEMSRGLTEQRTKDSGSAGMCEEKFYSIFSKQEEDRPGSNIPTSPRHALSKVKDNALKTSTGTKPVKLILPKGAGEGGDVNTFKETPTVLTSNEIPDGAKPGSSEMPLASSVTPNPRPESTCSLDSKAAGKPPVVPPKSEKALRRAKKLATRRKRTENKQRKQSSDGAETDPALSSLPMSPPSVPTSPLPTVCPPVPQQQLTSYDFSALRNSPALNNAQSIASVHSFPLSQRKLLQDPETGQYFVVDIPIQVQRKTLYDPETGNYFQVSIPSTGQNTTLDFFNTSYVLYPGFLSFPLMPTLRPPSQMSAPAVLLELQKEEESLNERTNFGLGDTEEQENQPYIETLYDCLTGSRAGSEKETWCNAMNSQMQPEDHSLELIVMGELEDIAIENN